MSFRVSAIYVSFFQKSLSPTNFIINSLLFISYHSLHSIHLFFCLALPFHTSTFMSITFAPHAFLLFIYFTLRLTSNCLYEMIFILLIRTFVSKKFIGCFNISKTAYGEKICFRSAIVITRKLIVGVD